MALDPRLLEILACPDDKGPLYYFESGAGGGGPDPGAGSAPQDPGAGGVPQDPGAGGVPRDTGGALLCPACRRRYDVRDDIPVMLIDEATVLRQAEVDALLERARAEGITPTFEP